MCVRCQSNRVRCQDRIRRIRARDTAAPGRYSEYFVDESWVEHLRRLERFTAADAGLRDKRQAFHRGSGPPAVRRFVAEGLHNAGPWAG